MWSPINLIDTETVQAEKLSEWTMNNIYTEKFKIYFKAHYMQQYICNIWTNKQMNTN